MGDSDDEMTTIPLTKRARKRLKVWKTERELTYNGAINELLDKESIRTGEGQE